MSHDSRRGYTLIELLLVMAILILFVLIVLPSTASFFSGHRPKAAADQIRGELAAARAWAIEEGVPYRVALSTDGTRIRRAPEAEFNEPALQDGSSAARRVEHKFEKVIAEVVVDETSNEEMAIDGEWITIAIVMPDGTCRDDRLMAEGNGNQIVRVGIREQVDPDQPRANPSVFVVIRGITGHVRVVAGGTAAQANQQGQRP